MIVLNFLSYLDILIILLVNTMGIKVWQHCTKCYLANLHYEKAILIYAILLLRDNYGVNMLESRMCKLYNIMAEIQEELQLKMAS